MVQALKNARTSGRLHHAYLFTGTRGIGKTTVSRILAKSLNCTGADGLGGVTAQPCGVCQACTEIDADRYIDYTELDAASNRSIDEIRDLIERAAYKPSVGRYKVFMIDEAHQLTKDAFNALLKTLEEPPDYLKFVLATTDPEKMLPTVLSRCLQFNLRPMAPEVIHAHLQTVLTAEAVAVDAGSLRLLARAARGSMRDALSLTDQAIAYGGNRLDEAGVRTMLGSVDRQHAARLVQALAQRDGRAVIDEVDALRGLGLSASATLEEMAMLLQQMAVEQAVPGALDDSDPDTAGARQLAAKMPADETQLLYSIVVQGRAELHLLTDDYAALTMVLLRMLAFAPQKGAPSVPARAAPLQVAPREARLNAKVQPAVAPDLPAAEVVAVPIIRAPSAVKPIAVATGPARASPSANLRPRLRTPLPQASAASSELPPWLDDAPPDDPPSDDPPGGLGVAVPHVVISAVVVSPVAAPVLASVVESDSSLPVANTQIQRTALGEHWSELIRPLISRGSISALVRELALQAELVAIEPGPEAPLWRLRVERESLRQEILADKLQAALRATQAEPLQLRIEAGATQDTIARRDAEAREGAQRDAEQVIRNDPVVRELMAQFSSARIVPGSIKPIAELTRTKPP